MTRLPLPVPPATPLLPPSHRHPEPLTSGRSPRVPKRTLNAHTAFDRAPGTTRHRNIQISNSSTQPRTRAHRTCRENANPRPARDRSLVGSTNPASQSPELSPQGRGPSANPLSPAPPSPHHRRPPRERRQARLPPRHPPPPRKPWHDGAGPIASASGRARSSRASTANRSTPSEGRGHGSAWSVVEAGRGCASAGNRGVRARRRGQKHRETEEAARGRRGRRKRAAATRQTGGKGGGGEGGRSLASTETAEEGEGHEGSEGGGGQSGVGDRAGEDVARLWLRSAAGTPCDRTIASRICRLARIAPAHLLLRGGGSIRVVEEAEDEQGTQAAEREDGHHGQQAPARREAQSRSIGD